MSIFKAVADLLHPKKANDCKHKGRFYVTGSNRASPPCVTCADCGAEVFLDDALNVYFDKLNAILDREGVK